MSQVDESDSYPTIERFRADLAGKRHTITIERVDIETARARFTEREAPEHVGELAVVERSDGYLTKVCCVESEGHMGAPLDDVARAYAHGYGATYIESAP